MCGIDHVDVVLVSHFHFHLNEQLTDAGTLDEEPTWLPVFRELGVNMAILADFHSDSHPTDTGKIRLNEQKVYFEGCRRFSDRDFLLIPGEEPDANFGGHYMFVFPTPVYFTHVKQPATAKATQPFVEDLAPWGKVYHTSSNANEFDLMKKENGLEWQTHPRTKGTAGYTDAVREKDFFRSDRFLGGSFQSLPVDQSQKRLCEGRCLGLLDDMNNWTGPKYMIAEGDTYMKYPDDETYGQLVVNYVKVAKVPRFDDGWDSVLKAMRAGDFSGYTDGNGIPVVPGFADVAGRRLLRQQRRSSVPQLEHRRLRLQADLHGGSGMDLPSGVRRVGVGRRRYGRAASHRHEGNGAIRQSPVPGPV